MTPAIRTQCSDCGIGTITAGEWYMVRNEVWEQAWRGRLKPWHRAPGQQILCIACLERRIGRTLVSCDFSDAPVNALVDGNKSQRLRARLMATDPTPPKPKRGRPKGSKNKPKRRRGRPLGNKDRKGRKSRRLAALQPTTNNQQQATNITLERESAS